MNLTMERFWQRFDLYCEQNAEKTVFANGTDSLTYSQLMRQIDHICTMLASLGCKHGDRIAIDQVGTINRVSSFLAVMKYGCNYIHLDCRFTLEKKRKMLGELNVAYFITLEEPHLFDQTVSMNPWSNINSPTTNTVVAGRSNEFSITYYSGVNGNRDQIVYSSSVIMNWLLFNEEKLQLPFRESLTFLGSSGMELLFPLWLGNVMSGGSARFVVGDVNGFDIQTAVREVEDSVLILPIEQLGDLSDLDSFEHVVPDTLNFFVTFGEHLFETVRFKRYLSQNNKRWYNYYGFPRIQLVSSISQNESMENNHIGRGIINTKTHVLNSSLRSAPIGVINRLYVSGIGSPKILKLDGSVMKEEVDFFQGEKINPTNYSAKWSEQGTLTLSNRESRYVMIDGIELHLDELGDLLLMHPSVDDSWVDIRGGRRSQLYILGYVVMTIDHDHDGFKELNHYMSGYLPKGLEMSFIQMARLPRNNKGEVDRDYLRDRNELSSLELKLFESHLKDQLEMKEIRVSFSDDINNSRFIHCKPRIAKS